MNSKLYKLSEKLKKAGLKKEASKVVKLAQNSSTGTIYANSSPQSSVYINGVAEGKTQIKKEVPPGNYTIKLVTENGTASIERKVTVAAGEGKYMMWDFYNKSPWHQAKNDPEIVNGSAQVGEPPSASGNLLINSRPWSSVFINGTKSELGPREIPAGTYKVKLMTPSGATIERTVTVRPGETKYMMWDFYNKAPMHQSANDPEITSGPAQVGEAPPQQ